MTAAGGSQALAGAAGPCSTDCARPLLGQGGCAELLCTPPAARCCPTAAPHRRPTAAPHRLITPAPGPQVVCCKGRIIIPGMVNTHHHMYQTLTRCIAQVRPACPGHWSLFWKSPGQACPAFVAGHASPRYASTPGPARTAAGILLLVRLLSSQHPRQEGTCRNHLRWPPAGLAAVQLAGGAVPRVGGDERGGCLHRHQACLRRAAAHRLHLLLGCTGGLLAGGA